MKHIIYLFTLLSFSTACVSSGYTKAEREQHQKEWAERDAEGERFLNSCCEQEDPNDKDSFYKLSDSGKKNDSCKKMNCEDFHYSPAAFFSRKSVIVPRD